MNRDVLWTTDRKLQVASLSARLRELQFPDGVPSPLHVSELWNDEDPFGMMLVAHQWALDGEGTSFTTQRAGVPMRVVLEPLYDLSGAIAGVGGCASPGVGGEADGRLEILEEIERLSGFGAWRTDLKNDYTFWTAGLCELLGVPPETAPLDLRAFDHPEDRETVARAIRAGEIAGTGYRCEHRVLRPDGSVRNVREQTHVLYDGDGIAVALAGSVLDLTTAAIAYDRTLVEQRVHALMARVKNGGPGFAVLCVDVDDFRSINARHGREAGDQLLASISERLAHHVRASDSVVRLRGDDFTVVLDEIESPEGAQYAARAILQSFERPFHIAGSMDVRVGASIGGALCPGTAQNPRTLLESACREMRVVKRNGGRGIKIACESSSEGRSHLRTAVNA